MNWGIENHINAKKLRIILVRTKSNRIKKKVIKKISKEQKKWLCLYKINNTIGR